MASRLGRWKDTETERGPKRYHWKPHNAKPYESDFELGIRLSSDAGVRDYKSSPTANTVLALQFVLLEVHRPQVSGHSCPVRAAAPPRNSNLRLHQADMFKLLKLQGQHLFKFNFKRTSTSTTTSS